MRRSKPAPWFHDFLRRLNFEKEARGVYPALSGIKHGKGRNAQVRYVVVLEVPEYEPREVQVVFRNRSEIGIPTIFADGPKESPHRYRGGSLCIWDPEDTPERQWNESDGLAVLLDMIAVHLFKEAWWRETGEWLGDQHIHQPNKERAA